MKKIVFLLLNSVILNATIVDKIIYNGGINKNTIFFNSNLKEGDKLDIKKVDMLVENFKLSASNNIIVNIEPSDKKNYSNIIIENKKTPKFNIGYSFDNKEENKEFGKYRHTLKGYIDGFFLNEKLDINYTFQNPILPIRKNIMEENDEELDLTKARLNNNLNVNLTFPIKNSIVTLIYSNTHTKQSIITPNENIYDIENKINRYKINLKNRIYIEKENKIILKGEYEYIDKNTYIEDFKISDSKIHNLNLSVNLIKNKHNLEIGFIQEFQKEKYDPKFSFQYSYEFNENNTLKLENLITRNEMTSNLSYLYNKNNFYTNVGLEFAENKVKPKFNIAYRKKYKNLFFDVELEYNNYIIRPLFSFGIDIF